MEGISCSRIGPCDTTTDGEELHKMIVPGNLMSQHIGTGYTGDYEEKGGDENV